MADGEAAVFIFLQGLIERVAAAAGGGEGLELVPGIKREMENLSTTILAILPLVEDADKRVYLPDVVSAWLGKVMDAAQIADDILKHLALQADKDGGVQSGGDRNLCCISLSCSTSSESHCESMNAIVNRFDQLAKERDDLMVELLRFRKMLLADKEMEEEHRRGIPNPTSPKFEISVTDESGYWWKKINAEELIISGLKNVNSGEEAARARLIKRKHLETLTLQWGWQVPWDGRPRGVDDEVLENLQPYSNLKNLIIREHCGSKFPSWMENQWLSKLETIELYCCLTWLFTPLGKLPFLKYLNIVGSYRPIDPLEELQSYGTQGWEEEREREEDYQLFPNLRVLRISHCVKLTRLPLLPPTLTELYIRGIINLTALPGLWGVDGEAQGQNKDSSLSSLDISECCSITSLGQGLLQHRLGALEIMTIYYCPRLESFPDDGLRLLVSLKSLTIKDCSKLTWSPDHGGCLPASLVDLQIIRCPGITVDSFFMGMINLTSLVSLQIEGGEPFDQIKRTEAPELYNLPGELLCHLTALTELEIIGCPKLQMLGFQALASLRRLKIDACKNLHSPPSFESWGPPPLEYLRMRCIHLQFFTRELLQNLTSLKRLIMETCPTHKSLPDGFESLTKLEECTIIGCPGLESLPAKGFPASLSILVIRERGLSVERCQKRGADWPKIARIPYVDINKCQIQTKAWKQLALEGA